MTKHRYFLAALLTLTGILALSLFLGESQERRYREHVLPEKRKIVNALGLTDLSLWTEARYTRHPSQTDFFSAFQDFPASFEHFPAGSLVSPAPFLALKRGEAP